MSDTLFDLDEQVNKFLVDQFGCAAGRIQAERKKKAPYVTLGGLLMPVSAALAAVVIRCREIHTIVKLLSASYCVPW